MRRVAVVDNSTSRVVSLWQGGDEQTLPVRSGYTHVSLDEAAPNVLGHLWNGGTSFTAPAPARPRQTDRDVLVAIATKVGVVLP